MSDDKQGYAGIAQPASGATEYDRISFVARQIANKMATTTLVTVMAVGDGTVDVQPMVAQLDGAGNATPHGTIHNIPVWRLQAGTSAIIIDPVVGDIGLALFCQSDISSIKKTKKPGNPGSRRKFDWSDGIYLGGVLNAVPTQTIEMSDTDGVVITSAMPIKLVGAVEISETLTVAGKDFATHTHGGVTTGGGTSGPVT